MSYQLVRKNLSIVSVCLNNRAVNQKSPLVPLLINEECDIPWLFLVDLVAIAAKDSNVLKQVKQYLSPEIILIKCPFMLGFLKCLFYLPCYFLLFTVSRIALFTVTFSHLHDDVFERGREAISGNFGLLPEIASHPRSNTLSCKWEKVTVKRAISTAMPIIIIFISFKKSVLLI